MRLVPLAGALRQEERRKIWGELEPAFAKAGLDSAERELLRRVLPAWLKDVPLPTSSRGEALQGLRILEMTLARSTLCYAPPWGAVSIMLGLRTRPGSSDDLDPGWVGLASRPLAQPVGNRLKWCWLSTPRYVEANNGTFIGSGFVFGATLRSLLQLIGDHRPEVEFFPVAADLRSHLDVRLDIRVPRVGRGLPVARPSS